MANKGPHTWPTNAADDRNMAAELMSDADRTLEGLTSKLPPEHQVDALKARIYLQQGMRVLERQGAPTRVCKNPLAANL